MHASGHETPEARDLYASALDAAWERARRGDDRGDRGDGRGFDSFVRGRRGVEARGGGAEVEARARRRGRGGAEAAGRRPSAREIAGPF